MATPPTRVSYGASVFNTTTTPKTVNVTVQTGDRLVVASLGESGNVTNVTTAPTGGSLTYTQAASLGASSDARAIAWTATASGNNTFDVSCVRPSSSTSVWWGCCVWVYRNSDGFGTVGAPALGTVSNTVTLTTTGDNSALVVVADDYNALDGSSRTGRTVNGSTGTEETYFFDSVHHTVYTRRWDDTGSIGSVTAGYSAPTGQDCAIIAIEILGTTSVSLPPSLIMPTRRSY